MEAHRIVIIDRGVAHRHRWRASCSCGAWASGNRRRRRTAVRAHREHAEIVGQVARRARWNVARGPGEVTPVDLLPEELRPAG